MGPQEALGRCVAVAWPVCRHTQTRRHTRSPHASQCLPGTPCAAHPARIWALVVPVVVTKAAHVYPLAASEVPGFCSHACVQCACSGPLQLALQRTGDCGPSLARAQHTHIRAHGPPSHPPLFALIPSSRIPGTVLNVMVNVMARGMSLWDAVAAPRVISRWRASNALGSWGCGGGGGVFF